MSVFCSLPASAKIRWNDWSLQHFGSCRFSSARMTMESWSLSSILSRPVLNCCSLSLSVRLSGILQQIHPSSPFYRSELSLNLNLNSSWIGVAIKQPQLILPKNPRIPRSADLISQRSPFSRHLSHSQIPPRLLMTTCLQDGSHSRSSLITNY
jgi:hypothetical protein